MKYHNLPFTITSPITGEPMVLTEQQPNGEVLSVAQFLKGWVDCHDSYITKYESINGEKIYIPYEK